MEWIELILTAIGGSVVSLVGSMAYFRPKLAEAKAGASKAETEASDARVKYLIERVESVERLYSEQGKLLDTFRSRQLEIEGELAEKNRRITQLESENRALSEKIEQLDKEVQAYRTITGK